MAASALVAVASLSACASDPPDPATVQREQVQLRLEETFSDQQATCVLADLDEATITALAEGAALEADSEELADYSDAVATCVAGD